TYQLVPFERPALGFGKLSSEVILDYLILYQLRAFLDLAEHLIFAEKASFVDLFLEFRQLTKHVPSQVLLQGAMFLNPHCSRSSAVSTILEKLCCFVSSRRSGPYTLGAFGEYGDIRYVRHSRLS